MSINLNASLLTLTAIMLSLSLSACGKNDTDKPKAQGSTPSQASQPAELIEKPETTAPEIIADTPPTETPVTDTLEPDMSTTEPGAAPASQQQARSNKLMLALAKKSGCLACHSVDRKVVGPAWNDVSARYKNKNGARMQLIEKISKGGKGNWTDITGGVPMPPYFPRVTRENIGKLVDFVLSLEAN